MAKQMSENRELKNIGYELFIGGLSILSITNLVLGVIIPNDSSLAYVLVIMNAIVTPIFFADFCYRFFTTTSKSGYFFRGFGWADLLASLPFPQVKIFRLFRVWRVIRLSKTFGLRNLLREFIDHRAPPTFSDLVASLNGKLQRPVKVNLDIIPEIQAWALARPCLLFKRAAALLGAGVHSSYNLGIRIRAMGALTAGSVP